MLSELAGHLWQSTLFAIAAGLLALAFRHHRAQVRYWIWFSASCKFFVPFFLLASLAGRLEWVSAGRKIATRIAPSTVSVNLDPFTGLLSGAVPFQHSTPSMFPWLLIVWACGFAAVILIRIRDWRRIRAAVRFSAPMTISGFETSAKLAIRCSPGLLEPGVVGLWRSVVLLPAGLTEHLTPAQLKAVLGHELAHVRRRDNLFAAAHMIAEAIFWFHPLVWWIGGRLVEERERACDEEVLSRIAEPLVYAEGILNVCKLYTESPLACVSGVSGADLKRRIEAIMAHRIGRRLNRANRFLLAAVGIAALAGPLLLDIGHAPAMRAQSPDAPAQFEVASIKPNNSGANTLNIRIAPGGRLTAANASLRSLIAAAYQVRYFQLSGGPPWIDSAKYDIEAKGPLKEGEPKNQQISKMLQALLADRFQLTLHRETRELPLYELRVAKNGPKLEPSQNSACFDPAAGIPFPAPVPGQPPLKICGGFNHAGPGQLFGTGVTMARFAANLSQSLDRTVVDKTGLDGTYDISLRWSEDAARTFPAAPDGAPPAADDPGPSLSTAMGEQLGLRLESKKGPVEILVIDHADKPSAN